ncbi:MAG: hypothetical protein QG561_856 [Patescibacteria group bacterium]|nr:hypothetical protein [Patescibacteria group bacterium]
MSSAQSVAAGIFAKASFVGANTVNGPELERVSTSPPACTAATRVERIGVAIAASTMVGRFKVLRIAFRV